MEAITHISLATLNQGKLLSSQNAENQTMLDSRIIKSKSTLMISLHIVRLIKDSSMKQKTHMRMAARLQSSCSLFYQGCLEGNADATAPISENHKL